MQVNRFSRLQVVRVWGKRQAMGPVIGPLKCTITGWSRHQPTAKRRTGRLPVSRSFFSAEVTFRLWLLFRQSRMVQRICRTEVSDEVQLSAGDDLRVC